MSSKRSFSFIRNWTPVEGMIPALSFRQPWGWAVAGGIKPIENRNWPTKYRGLFLIHAGATWDTDLYFGKPKCFQKDAWQRIVNYHVDGDVEVPDEASYTLGAIIGLGFIEGCITSSDNPWFYGPYGFVITGATLFENPIEYQGKLGWFGVPRNLVEEHLR